MVFLGTQSMRNWPAIELIHRSAPAMSRSQSPPVSGNLNLNRSGIQGIRPVIVVVNRERILGFGKGPLFLSSGRSSPVTQLPAAFISIPFGACSIQMDQMHPPQHVFDEVYTSFPFLSEHDRSRTNHVSWDANSPGPLPP